MVPHFINVDDIGMVQPCEDLRFLSLTSQLLGIGSGNGDYLDRHEPVERFLPCFIDDARGAAANFFQKLVTGELEIADFVAAAWASTSSVDERKSSTQNCTAMRSTNSGKRL